ncbi:hypothetical protein [Morganella psychrotolerans]
MKIAAFKKEGQDAGESSDEDILTAYYRSKPFNDKLALEMMVRGHKAISL